MLDQVEEETDQRPDFVEGIFYIHKYTWKQICLCRKPKQVQRICVYDARSLYLFHHRSCFRKFIVSIAESATFETVCNLIIVLATLVMLLTDPLDPNNSTLWNQRLNYTTQAIVIIFTCEMLIKVVAQGLIMHPNSFLRDYWNLIDLFVVVTGIIEMTPISGIQLTGMRPLRVLRTLRSIKSFPNMRRLIQGMIDSVPTLFNAVIFMAFVYLQFAIFGTQQFGGDYYSRCRYEPTPPETGEWAYSDDRLCSLNEDAGYQCPSGQTCGQWKDSLIDMELIDYGLTNFDNILSSLWTIFQCITLEGWTNIMYNLLDAESQNWLVPTFFVGLVILGSLFLINVVLAIFSDSLEKQEAVRLQQENKRKNLIALSVKRQKAQQASKQAVEDLEYPETEMATKVGQVLKNRVLHSLDETNITIEEPAPAPAGEQKEPVIYILHDILGDQIALELPTRVHNNFVFRRCFILNNRPIYQIFIQLMIITNFFVLASDRYPVSESEVAITDAINTSISFVFVFEMVVKLLGYGIKEYARDSFNLFEALIVCTSMVELILYYVSGGKGALTAFRAIRILRMFKLSRRWKAFTLIFNKILDSLKDIGYFLILMAIFIIVFTILGMQFFAGTVYLDSEGHLTTADLGVVPVANFDSAYNAFVTVFTVTIGDDWNQIMYNYARYNFTLATFYFYSLITTTNIILLNLFLALLLQNFQQPLKASGQQDLDVGGLQQLQQKLYLTLRKVTDQCLVKFGCTKRSLEQSDSESEEEIKRKSAVLQQDLYEKRLNTGNLLLVQSMQQRNKSFIRVSDLNLAENEKKDQNSFSIANIAKSDLLSFVQAKQSLVNLEGTSLLVFSRTNKFRKFIASVVCHKHFDNIIIFVILVSTINLSLDSPLNDPNSSKTFVTNYLDIAITVIFAFEAVLKIIVFGLLWNGKNSYLRTLWNIIDLLTVLISIISQATPAQDDNLSFFKLLRAIRFLRPLRIIQKNQGLKIAVHSLINALPGILNLAIICGSLLTIFSILGVNLFKGGFSTCDMTNIPLEVQDDIQTLWDCLDYGGEWVNYQYNFDNLLQAFKTQFCIMTTEGWFNIYWMTYNYTDSYYAMPQSQSSPYSILYFIVCLFVTHLFLLNMFVGVVISTFNIEKEKLNHNTHLTKLESEYIDTCVLCYKTKPVAVRADSGSCIRDKMRQLADHKATDITIFCCISLNALVLMLEWYDEPVIMHQTLDMINDCLSVIFTLEFLIKVIGYGRDYFKSIWNLVDLFVVVTSWIDFSLLHFTNSESNSSFKIIRTFRVVRIMKLMRRFKEMQRILNTFLQAIPALLNVGGLLFLFLYLYAVGAVYLFSTVKLQSALNQNANFQSFGLALLTLFRMSTGENWNDIMEDCARQRSIDFLCHSQTYEQQQSEGIQGCGNPAYSYVFFCSFMVFITFIMLNLFIAIILEAFERQLMEEAQTIQPEIMEEFVHMWKEYDPQATGFIPIDKLEALILQLLQREQTIKKLRPNSQDVLFNLHECRLLSLYNAWRLQHDDGSSQYKAIKGSVRMQRLLHRHFDGWIGGLMIPTYSNVQQFYFHDVLLALIKFFFSQKHKEAFHQRQQRIQNLIETGQELTFLDQVSVRKELFDKLSQFDKMKYNELASENFLDVIESIELKGKRTEKQIARLQSMLEMRRKISLRNAKYLDDFKDIVITSNHVTSAKIITKFIKQKNAEIKKRKERRRQALQLNVLNRNFQNLLRSHEGIKRTKQITQKQFQQYEIEDQIVRNRNLRYNFSSGSSLSSSSSQCRSSKRESKIITDFLQDQQFLESSSSSIQSSFDKHKRPQILIESPCSYADAQEASQSLSQSTSFVPKPNKTIQELQSAALKMEIEFQDLLHDLDRASSKKYLTNQIKADTKITKGQRTLYNMTMNKKLMH